MHPESYAAMAELLARAPASAETCLDVGSFDVNGTFRPLAEARGWTYTGIDIREGPNVDAVVDPYHWGGRAGRFDVVLSGSTLEHVERPWLWIKEAARVLKPGGLLALHTHWSFPLHEYPRDYWRFMPAGIETLFDEAGLLERYDIQIINSMDIVGAAFKREAAR